MSVHGTIRVDNACVRRVQLPVVGVEARCYFREGVHDFAQRARSTGTRSTFSPLRAPFRITWDSFVRLLIGGSLSKE